ncbi:MAG: type VI secretion system-associated protein TagF [Cytophagales bacterium]|nr:type VI secretion system-associated protein TagF [Rhizobacter sp.]
MATPGWYGKLAMLGDFAHRRLPLGFVNACDAWLSQGVAASRESLGSAWLDNYRTAPLWCFAWSPRVVDEQWWFGVLMPSVDAVGRYFPLVVAFNTEHAPTEPHVLAQWAQWYDSAGACALQTLQGQATLDEFESALAAAGTPLTTAPADSASPQPFTSELQLHPAKGAWPQDAATVVLRALTARLQGHSTWWVQGDSETPPPVTAMRGLPTADRFVALFQGAL